MENRRRNNLEISLAILDIAKIESGKTRMVYRANLNFKIIKKYLKELVQNELLEEYPGKHKTWKTTDKGNIAVEQLKNAISFF